MKKRVLALSIGVSALLFLAACSDTSAPSYSSEEINSEVQALSDDLVAVGEETKDDPAIAAITQILQNFNLPNAINSYSLNPTSLLKSLTFDPTHLVPLISTIETLPRLGVNASKPESPPVYFDPPEPFDFEFIWWAIGKTGDYIYPDLKVDWDRDGKSTVEVWRKSGIKAERPVSSEALLDIGDGVENNQVTNPTRAGRAELEAQWYLCGEDYIEEPTKVYSNLEVGLEHKLRLKLDYALKEGDLDTYAASFSVAGEGTSGRFEQRFELTSSGKTLRDGVYCWTLDYKPSTATIAFSTTVKRSGHTRSLEFKAAFAHFNFDESKTLTSVDVSGEIKINGRTAALFEGKLDDLHGESCPGSHVYIQFADETTTLKRWLEANGFCSPTTAGL